jgi:hypothetical protein
MLHRQDKSKKRHNLEGCCIAATLRLYYLNWAFHIFKLRNFQWIKFIMFKNIKPCGLSNFAASTALNFITHSKSIAWYNLPLYAANLKIAQFRYYLCSASDLFCPELINVLIRNLHKLLFSIWIGAIDFIKSVRPLNHKNKLFIFCQWNFGNSFLKIICKKPVNCLFQHKINSGLKNKRQLADLIFN